MSELAGARSDACTGYWRARVVTCAPGIWRAREVTCAPGNWRAREMTCAQGIWRATATGMLGAKKTILAYPSEATHLLLMYPMYLPGFYY